MEAWGRQGLPGEKSLVSKMKQAESNEAASLPRTGVSEREMLWEARGEMASSWATPVSSMQLGMVEAPLSGRGTAPSSGEIKGNCCFGTPQKELETRCSRAVCAEQNISTAGVCKSKLAHR
jgi:hypothetical protein